MKPHRRHLHLVGDGSGGDADTEIDAIEVVISDHSNFDLSEVADLHERLKRLAAEVIVDEGVGTGMLHLYLVDPGFMSYLNKSFMGYDGPTDVLAFPIDGPEMVAGAGVALSLVPDTGTEREDLDDADHDDDTEGVVTEGGRGAIISQSVDDDAVEWDDDDSVPIHLGDVMVCPQVAARQAPDHTGSLPAELSLLVIHGVLHVLGHDHAEPAESARMRSRERRHLDRLGYRHPADR